MSSILVLGIAAAAGLVGGCSREGAKAAQQRNDRAWFLALLDPKGHGKVDERVRALEERVQRAPQKAESWVELGQAWVRKARADGNPVHHLSAGACAGMALQLAPGNRLALDLRALVLLNDHRFDEARAVAQEVVDKEPEDPAA